MIPLHCKFRWSAPNLNVRALLMAFLGLALAGWGAGVIHANEVHAWCRYCRQLELQEAAAAAGGAETNTRKYAPSREIDTLHLAIDVTPDFQKRSIRATTTLTFKPIAKPISEIRLDAVDLRIETLTATRPVAGWQTVDNTLRIQFAEPIPADAETKVTVTYGASPEMGLYFRTPEMGYPSTDTHLWTQGEAEEARHWFPCFDSPNEKFTSEVTCRVPDGMTVISNGKQISSELDPTTRLRAVRWLQDKPHTAYLIALVAGKFEGITDTYRNIPMGFYSPPSMARYNAESFKTTKATMAFLEEEIGVPYAWDKYDQVCVPDFTAGGMENTTLTILTAYTLFSSDFETLRSSESLVAHELAHQWFGDLVTCKDWSHLWLNEGFATYYDALFQGHAHGRDQFLYAMYHNASSVINAGDDRIPIVHRGFADPMEQFSFRAYPKGAWVLHMLRSQLGVDLYRKCIKTYVERHRYGVTETEDLVRVIEELSGRSFDRFFDQYVFHPQQPSLSLNYDWNASTRLAKVTITQNQKTADGALLFTMPATVRFKGNFGTKDFPITFSKQTEDFYFALPESPNLVRFDPEFELLAKVEFPLSTSMMLVQLADASDMIGRMLATQQLRKKGDSEVINALKKRLNEDAFFGVRIAASEALRAIGTEDAMEALRSSLQQSDARVRSQVLKDAGGPYSEKSLEVLKQSLRTERNPDIRAAAIRELGAYRQPDLKGLFLAELQKESFRGVLSDAALSAIRAQDDPSYLPEVLKAARENETRWPTGVYGQALQTLGHLGRNEDKKQELRDYLLGELNDLRNGVKMAAMRGLGTLGDPSAASALDKFRGLKESDRLRKTAEQAANDLRALKKPGVELGELRSELLKVQQENKELRKEFETLNRKIEALSKTSSAAPAASSGKARSTTDKRGTSR